MADIKKEQEREELHRAIWAIADELRGSVDGWDFKSYVLGTMFYRYISENLTEYINANEIAAGDTDFDYARLSDDVAEEKARGDMVSAKGFFMLPSELFCNVRARAPQDENLNETLEKVFRHIEDSAKGSSSEQCFSGLFDDFDVNSNKLGATVAKRNDWYNSMLFITNEDMFMLQYYLQRVLGSAEAMRIVAEKSGIALPTVPLESMKMAMTVIATGPIVLLYPFVQRYFVKGLTIGAVKG